MRMTASAALGGVMMTGSVTAEQDTATSDGVISAPYGAQVGDMVEVRALVWSRASAPARMYVYLSPDPAFSEQRTIHGPAALAATDHTATVDLVGLPREEEIHYRVIFGGLRHPDIPREPVGGSFRNPQPRFWGMKTFETMLKTDPDFFTRSGDAVSADGSLPECVELDNGGVWTNVVTEVCSQVADTLDEFRAITDITPKISTIGDSSRRSR